MSTAAVPKRFRVNRNNELKQRITQLVHDKVQARENATLQKERYLVSEKRFTLFETKLSVKIKNVSDQEGKITKKAKKQLSMIKTSKAVTREIATLRTSQCTRESEVTRPRRHL